jgi:hypothetical protein
MAEIDERIKKLYGNKIRVGIIGCANIARKNIRAIKKSRNSILIAVASRDIEKAKIFAKENDLDEKIVQLYGSYDDLLNNKYIQLVYLPLPTCQHLQWAIKVAEAQKHILIEKPCALNSDDLVTMMNSFQSRGLVFMDGVMFMHNPIIQRLRSTLSDPFAGTVSRLNSSFSFRGGGAFFENNIRIKQDGDPLGALGDLGWYNIRLALIAFLQGHDVDILSSFDTVDWERITLPRTVKAISHHMNVDNVPLDCDGEIIFGKEKSNEKKMFKFDCSFLLPIRQSYEISLTNDKGYCDKVITGKYFVLPRCPSEAKFEIESGLAGYGDMAIRNLCNVECISETVYIDQEVEMFNTLGDIIKGTESDLETKTESLKKALYFKRIALITQLTVDACYQSLNNNSNPVEINYEILNKIA